MSHGSLVSRIRVYAVSIAVLCAAVGVAALARSAVETAAKAETRAGVGAAVQQDALLYTTVAQAAGRSG